MKRQQHVQHLLSDYIDGCLSARAMRGVEAHLASCPACACELKEWRSLLRLVSHYASVPCPIDCADVVLQRLDQGAGRLPRARPWSRLSFTGSVLPPPPVLWATVAVVLVALLGGWTWLQESRAPQGMTTARTGSTTLSLPPAQAIRGEAPERLDGAFSRSDSLILASDFAAEE
jgi:anti-sigma factor RsiW